MGRAKNKKANNPPQSQQQSQQPIPPVAVDTPLSTTTPALADLVHDEADDPIPLIDDDPLPDETPVIPPLQPYLSLLPALRGVGQATQQALHDALFTAGSTAAQALESYLKDKSFLNQMEGAPVEGAEATVGYFYEFEKRFGGLKSVQSFLDLTPASPFTRVFTYFLNPSILLNSPDFLIIFSFSTNHFYRF